MSKDIAPIGGVKEVKERMVALERLKTEALTEGLDYMTLVEGQKPTLLKPGAEKLALMFGLTTQLHLEEKVEDHERGYFYYRVKCVVANRNGELITEGYGSANSKERPQWSRDPFKAANTVLKIAEKRAYVDAILRATGGSWLFTQDLEDMEEAEERPNMATEKQLNYLARLEERLRKMGHAEEAEKLTQWLEEHAGKITKDQASKAIERALEVLNSQPEVKPEDLDEEEPEGPPQWDEADLY